MVCICRSTEDNSSGCRTHVSIFNSSILTSTNLGLRFPEVGYFRDPNVQSQLTNILFLYSVTNPSVGYRQGMHELLAPLYHAVDFDSISQDADTRLDPGMLEFCSSSWIAADAWGLFEAVMRGVSRWYEWRE
jgi:TBC1 domain family member 5